MSAEDFRRHGRAVVDWVADYMERVEDLPVSARVKPGEIRSRLPPHPPDEPEPFEAMLADVDAVLLDGITHWQSPNFFAYFPANSSGPSILGELLSAGLGVQGMLWSTSPACTELETHVLDWLVELCGLPARFRSDGSGGGVIHDSASSAVLCALLAARHRALERGVRRDQLVAYTSGEAHSSVEKAARVAGLEPHQLVAVGVDHDHALDVSALESAMAADRARHRVPFFVAATAGTTSSTAFDPVAAIAGVAGKHGAWLHVDGALSGAAAVCAELRWVVDGLDRADSYAFNPHKWLLTNFDCDCFWVADRAALVGALGVLPEYLRNAASDSGAVIDYRDWQIPLGRRFRALKLWFVLRYYGAQGLRAHIAEHVALASELTSWVCADARFELAAPTTLNLVCFRLRGGDAASQRLLEALNSSGRVFMTHTRLDGRFALRLAVGGTRTARHHVEAAWRLIGELADEVLDGG